MFGALIDTANGACRRLLTAIKHSEVMTGFQSQFDQMPAKKFSATKDQNLHCHLVFALLLSEAPGCQAAARGLDHIADLIKDNPIHAPTCFHMPCSQMLWELLRKSF
jgi:mannose/cellobiose epimerase-like protein (N-acyl-D-glucosamine 2-epimerase family)